MSEEKIIQHSQKAVVKDYQPTVDYYDTIWRQINTHKINAAWIDSNSGSLINTSYFEFDGSRFEGFKSSGYLRNQIDTELNK